MSAPTEDRARARRGRLLWGVLVLGAVSALMVPSAALAGNARTKRVSVRSSGGQLNDDSYDPAVSANGRYVAFTSLSSGEVLVRDRKRRTTHTVSVSSTGVPGNDLSETPAISADGRYVAFVSDASNLVPGDTNGTRDVFVRDRKLHTTTRVSVSSTGRQANDLSGSAAISASGRYVSFDSDASNLVPGDTNQATDVFVWDRKRHTTKRVSVSSAGRQVRRGAFETAISANGRYVAFVSTDSHLVPGDTNGTEDVFVRDRKRRTTRRVSVSSAHRQRKTGGDEPAISADGRYVAFDSIVLKPHFRRDVFVRDRKRHTTRRVSVPSSGRHTNGDSSAPAISADGRYVAFGSDASNLIAGDTNGRTDVCVRDRKHHRTKRVSVSSAGRQGRGASSGPAVSADGRYVAFSSSAPNLVRGDTNHETDVFVRGPLP